MAQDGWLILASFSSIGAAKTADDLLAALEDAWRIDAVQNDRPDLPFPVEAFPTVFLESLTRSGNVAQNSTALERVWRRQLAKAQIPVAGPTSPAAAAEAGPSNAPAGQSPAAVIVSVRSLFACPSPPSPASRTHFKDKPIPNANHRCVRQTELVNQVVRATNHLLPRAARQRDGRTFRI